MGATSRIRARDGWLVGLVVAGVIAVSIAARSRPVAASSTPTPGGLPIQPSRYSGGGVGEGNGRSRTFHLGLHFGAPHWLAGVLKQSLVALGVVLVLLLLIKVVPQVKRRRAHRPPPAEVEYAPDDPAKVRQELSSTFDTTLERLQRGAPEEAIIACWVQLEALAEVSGFAAQPWQTAGEAAELWLSGLPFDHGALAELAELYREARFSHHRMPAAKVEVAQRTLRRLRSSLAEPPLKPSDV